MNRALIIVPLSVATAVVLAASWAHALPSCCQQDGAASAASNPYFQVQGRIQAPNTPHHVLPAVRVSAPSPRASQPTRNVTRVKPPGYGKARPVQASAPGCCPSPGLARQPGYELPRTQSGSCCGGYMSVAQSSCCGGAPVGYTPPALPPCCSVDGAVSGPGFSVRRGTATPTAIPVSVPQQRSYSWGLSSVGAGGFGRPAYFPGTTVSNNPW